MFLRLTVFNTKVFRALNSAGYWTIKIIKHIAAKNVHSYDFLFQSESMLYVLQNMSLLTFYDIYIETDSQIWRQLTDHFTPTFSRVSGIDYLEVKLLRFQ